MVERKLSRGVVNKRINKILRVFLWGTEEDQGLVPETVAATLKLIRRLEAHRSPAKDYPPVLGVDPKTARESRVGRQSGHRCDDATSTPDRNAARGK